MKKISQEKREARWTTRLTGQRIGLFILTHYHQSVLVYKYTRWCTYRNGHVVLAVFSAHYPDAL